MSAFCRAALATVLLAMSGCGSGTEPAKPAEAPTKESTPAAEPAAEPAEPAEGKAEAAKPDEAQPADQKPREVTYTQSPEGLKVQVAGVRFLATAATARVGDGWGVKVKVSAKAEDGKPHKLLSPKNGPLAFAGKVERDGKTEKLADERSGEDEKTVEEKGLEFSREWPGKSGTKPLKSGDKLELQVGLWGVGESSDELRPVRQFLVVKMAAGKHKPQPVISPPATAEASE